MTKTAFKQVNGVQVYVSEDGTFHAEIGGQSVKRKDFRAIEKMLAEQSESVQAIFVGYSGSGELAKVTRIESDGRYRFANRQLESSGVYEFDAEVWAEMQAIADARKRLREQFQEAESRLKKLTKDAFKRDTDAP